MNWTEILGFVTGAASVLLAVRESAWNWPVGIANNIFFFILFWKAKSTSCVRNASQLACHSRVGSETKGPSLCAIGQPRRHLCGGGYPAFGNAIANPHSSHRVVN